VPGPITAARSRGTHRLIRKGAKLVTAAAHILEELHINSPPGVLHGSEPDNPDDFGRLPATKGVCVEAQLIVDALGEGAADVDTLASQTGLTPQEVLRMLLEMEISGIVEQFPGVGFGLQRDRVEQCSSLVR